MTIAPSLPRPPVDAVSLPGRTVDLARLAPERDGLALWRAIGSDPGLWGGIPSGPFADEGEFAAWLRERAGRPSEDAAFTVLDKQGLGDRAGRQAGLLFLLHIDPSMGAAEIGLVYGPGLSRRTGGTEGFFLLARHLFETLQYRRLEWRCSTTNAASHRAAARFGLVAEGVMRQARWIKGANYDTAIYSIIDREWPALASRFEAWLAPENFTDDGIQIRKLSAFA